MRQNTVLTIPPNEGLSPDLQLIENILFKKNVKFGTPYA